MPAIDNCEPQIVHAVEKDGWMVIDQPYLLHFPRERGYVLADLRLQRVDSSAQIIVLEVKCFHQRSKWLEDFYHAIGQYMTYRTVMQLKKIDVPLYLAVPSEVYNTFFQRNVIQETVRRNGIHILAVNLETEEIDLWVT